MSNCNTDTEENQVELSIVILVDEDNNGGQPKITATCSQSRPGTPCSRPPTPCAPPEDNQCSCCSRPSTPKPSGSSGRIVIPISVGKPVCQQAESECSSQAQSGPCICSALMQASPCAQIQPRGQAQPQAYSQPSQAQFYSQQPQASAAQLQPKSSSVSTQAVASSQSVPTQMSGNQASTQAPCAAKMSATSMEMSTQAQGAPLPTMTRSQTTACQTMPQVAGPPEPPRPSPSATGTHARKPCLKKKKPCTKMPAAAPQQEVCGPPLPVCYTAPAPGSLPSAEAPKKKKKKKKARSKDRKKEKRESSEKSERSSKQSSKKRPSSKRSKKRSSGKSSRKRSSGSYRTARKPPPPPEDMQFNMAPRVQLTYVDHFLKTQEGVIDVIKLGQVKKSFEKKCKKIISTLSGVSRENAEKFFMTILDAIQVKFPETNTTEIKHFQLPKYVIPILTEMKFNAELEFKEVHKYHKYIVQVSDHVEWLLDNKRQIVPEAVVDIHSVLLSGIVCRFYPLFYKMKNLIYQLVKKNKDPGPTDLIKQLRKLILTLYVEISSIDITFNNVMTRLNVFPNVEEQEKFRKILALRKTHARQSVMWVARCVATLYLYYFLQRGDSED